MDWFCKGVPLTKLNRVEFAGALVATALFLTLVLSLIHSVAAVWQLYSSSWVMRLVPLLLSMGFFQGITSLLIHLKADRRLRGDALRLYLLARLRRLLMLVSLPGLAGGLVYGTSWLMFQQEIVAGVATAITSLLSLLLTNRAFPVPEVSSENDIVQGARLLSYEAAKQKATQLSQNDPFAFPWGGVSLPAEAATSHGLVWGAPGTGKTLLLLKLMQTVLPRIGQGHNQRAVVYDPKNQLLPSLRCMGLRCPVLVGNPFDRRAVKLDLAQEVMDEAMALTLAQSLVPMEATVHQPYFARTAQVVLSGLIQALMAIYPGTWTLRHLLLVAESAERIRATLAQVPETQRYVTQHAQPDKAEETFQSVLSELGGKLEVYRPLAAAWERTSGERTIRLREWVQQESILVLGYDPDRSGAAAAANRIVLNLLAQIVLGLAPNQWQKQTKNRRFFVLLDEFETLERLERIGKLLAEGRDRGVCGILGLHAWSELKQHYGADGANAIIAQISNKVFLRVEEDETEAKVLKFFGAHKRYESSVSRQHLPHGVSLGAGEA